MTNSRNEPSAAFAQTAARNVREREAAIRPGARDGLRRLGRDVGGLRQLRARPTSCSPQARSRSRASPRTRRPCACSRPSARRRTFGNAKGVIAAERHAPERARARGCRCRQRRQHGRRGQHDRRQARAPASDAARSGTGSTCELSRFAPGAVVTVDAPDGQLSPRGAGGQQLSLVRGSSASTSASAGQRRSTASIRVRYPWGGESVLRNVRADRVVADRGAPPRRQGVDATAASPTLATCTRRTGTAGRSRGSGTTTARRRAQRRRRARAGAGPRPLRSLLRDVAGVGRVRRAATQPTKAPSETPRSATPPIDCSCGARRSARTSTGRSRC